jgi:NAD(P)-dependent dehydrogenase (short-subunit alcohol dehydrogenase family)
LKKNIIVFGGSGLIGGALMNSTYLQEKYRLINFDIKVKKSKLINFKCNVLKIKKIENSLNIVIKKYGNIYGAINATYPKVLQKNDPGSVDPNLFTDEVVDHFKSFLNTTQTMCNYFKKKKNGGKIINFSSIYGEFIPRLEIYKNNKIKVPLQYLISKNSIIVMSKYFSKFYLKHKININCISPGGVFNNQEKNFLKNYQNFCSTGMLDPKDLIGITSFLLSQNSNKIFGQNIIVDDGFTL